MTRRGSYSASQKTLHWIVALAVICTIPVGLVMNRIPEGALQNRLYDLHRSFGMTIFALALVRVTVRFAHGVPPPAVTLTPFQSTASTVVHRLLYVLLILMPLLGWSAMSAYGGEWSVFGLFTPPPIVPKSESLSLILFKLHELCGILMAGVVLAHIGAALMHFFILRDRVLARMLPNRGGPPAIHKMSR